MVPTRYQASQLDEEVRNSIEKYQLTDLHSLVALLRSLGYRTRIVNNMIATPVREERGNKQQSRNKKRGGSREQLSTSCDKSPYFQSNAKQSRSQQFKRPRSVRMNHTASDEEFETPKKIRKKLVATDREACISHSDKYIDEWLEISVEEDWVPVHCKLCKLTNAYSCVELATPNSFQYVVASEREGKVRDVSARYCLDWGGKYAKMKPDNDSWLRILSLWCDSRDEEDRLEDKQLMSIQLSLPSPSTLSQYKCNPIYILERHILKFQAIYPADVLPVGIFRGDRVYHRDNVMELHTRENWLKEGRVISKGSTAYKLARGRTKPGSDPKQERKIELFGKWQTEIYIAPPVVDGKVPKNEFGNVELFQESMLPSGAAHVDIPGAAIVARKLGIDYALAMVGWEFHGIACHPVFRGVVVATENEGVLLEAWREGKEEKREKEKVVREKKVFERWRRVIRSALIKQRVDKKYKFTDNQMD